jgi:GNAT superfamily N-acetyltransferase
MKDISVREAIENDIAELRQLEQELIEFERSFDACIKEADVTYYDLASLIADSNSAVFVAESNAEIIASGYAQIRQSKSYLDPELYCYLGFIYVEPQSRGHGLSTKILDSLTDWARSLGVKYFCLDVYSENSGAIRAYQKYGFKPLTVKMELAR